MKKLFFLIPVLVSLGCGEKKQAPQEQVTTYYAGFANGDYTPIKSTLADSLITTEGDYTMPFSRESYYEKFKWDSVFKTEYQLVDINYDKEAAIATVSLKSPRLAFLENSPMTCKYRFEFENGQIARIANLECPTANWEIWGERVNELVGWTKENHPELDGFINDLTMKGAQNYMQAIQFYQNRPRSD